jgi:hypothetical protein
MKQALIAQALIVLVIVALSLTSHARSPRQQDDAGRGKRQGVIGCTMLGCAPVPPGCGKTMGTTWSGLPTGFEVVVCPPGVQPFR